MIISFLLRQIEREHTASSEANNGCTAVVSGNRCCLVARYTRNDYTSLVFCLGQLHHHLISTKLGNFFKHEPIYKWMNEFKLGSDYSMLVHTDLSANLVSGGSILPN